MGEFWKYSMEPRKQEEAGRQAAEDASVNLLLRCKVVKNPQKERRR